MEKVTIPALQQMKRDGRKIVGVVAWDYLIAQSRKRGGTSSSVGDSVGFNLWGQTTETEVTIEELLVVCKAVRRGVKRALVSCDIPYGPVQAVIETSVSAAVRLVKEGGADMVKIKGVPEMVRAIVRAGIPVFAEFHGEQVPTEKLVQEAKRLKRPASLGTGIPAGGVGGRESSVRAGARRTRRRSWLDGRVRLAHTAIGYGRNGSIPKPRLTRIPPSSASRPSQPWSLTCVPAARKADRLRDDRSHRRHRRATKWWTLPMVARLSAMFSCGSAPVPLTVQVGIVEALASVGLRRGVKQARGLKLVRLNSRRSPG